MARATVWILAVSLGASLAAQPPLPRFEVASVKRAESLQLRTAPIPRALPGGQFRADHATVVDLLWFAYGVRQHLVDGGPDWAWQDRFEISARAETDAPADQIRLMVRSLLADRFQLVMHVEPREMRYQALVRARPDGSLGAGLERLDECSSAMVTELRRTFPEKYPSPGRGALAGCSANGLGTVADILTDGLGTPVLDATGLTDSYYFSIRSQFSPIAAVTGRIDTNPNLPALSTAIEEQLGLRLEPRRGPLDVWVIDSVEEPAEN